MKLDPAKHDYTKLVAALERLSAFNPKGQRDWPADTVKTLKSGKLEHWDLIEFVVERYDSQLAPEGDVRPKWEHSRALLALIAEMDALKLGSPKTATVREALESWTLQ